MFRAYFLYFWLVCNFLFSILTVYLAAGSDITVLNEGMTFTVGFTLFMASIVIFKLLFSTIYCLKWNFRQCCSSDYKKSKGDVAEEFRRIRKDKDAAMSSDEDDDDEKVFNMDEEGNPVVIMPSAGDHEIDDSDNDDVEFEDAKEEEHHDKTIESMWKQKALEISKATIGGKSGQRLRELYGSVHS